MIRFRVRMAALSVLALAACAPVPSAKNAEPPAAFASLNPCTDALLVALADPAQIAALSSWSRDPAQTSIPLAIARRYPSVSGSVEEIVALGRVRVVASTYTPPATRAAMLRLGLALDEFAVPTTAPESIAQVRRMAALVGHPDRGEALVGRIEAALAAAAPPPGARPVPALLWEGGGMVPGDGTLVADLLHRAGFANFGTARGYTQAEILPLEKVLADPPRVILAGGNDRALTHPVLAALQGTPRFAFDPGLTWCGGPTIIRAAARLAAIRNAL